MACLFLEGATALNQPLILVADAYYASRKIILPLLMKGHHLVTRLRITAVAYYSAPTPEKRKQGRPKLYGEKVKLRELAKDTAAFIAAASPVYGECGVELTYRCIDLLWRPIALYGYPFKIEVGFRQALHVIGAYAYHFWMKTMTPIRKNDGNQKLYTTSPPHTDAQSAENSRPTMSMFSWLASHKDSFSTSHSTAPAGSGGNSAVGCAP